MSWWRAHTVGVARASMANRQQRRGSRAAGRKQTGAVDMAEPETPAKGQREPRATTPATGAKRSIAELIVGEQR